MWVIFTYIYNSLLILFIAVHLLVGAIITFFLGMYVGIYLTQNYEIPRIDEPFKLWSYFVKFLDQRKRPGAMSIFKFTRRSESSCPEDAAAAMKIQAVSSSSCSPLKEGSSVPGDDSNKNK